MFKVALILIFHGFCLFLCRTLIDGSLFAIRRFFLFMQVTAFKLQAAKLAALNKRLYGMKVGDFW